MFPFSVRRQLSFDVPEPETLAPKLMAVLERELESRKAAKMCVSGNLLRFRGGPFRLVSSVNLLVPVTRGEVSITCQRSALLIEYRLWFTQLLVISALGAGFLGGGPWLAHSVSAGKAVGLGLFAFAWLAGGNLLLVLPRFRGFIKACVRKSLRDGQ
jgi:hypothetical protein